MMLPPLPKSQMSIVLLGPGEAHPKDLCKRRQILNELQQCGYTQTKLGEDFARDESEMPWPVVLRALVSNLDLILVLESGVAAVTELAILWPDPRAREITRVWCKREYATPERTTPRQIIDMFHHWFFSQEEFDACDLIADFVQAAERTCFNKAQRQGLLSDIGLLP